MSTGGPRLDVRRFDDIHAFLGRVSGWLAEREAEHNLILGITHQIAATWPNPARPAPLLATVENDGNLVGLAIQTPPWNVVLSEIDDPGALAALVVDLSADHGSAKLPGVTGPAEHAGEFADLWSARTGAAVRLDIRQRIFRLTELVPPPPSAGRARTARQADRELLISWMTAFNEEAFDRPPPLPAEDMVDDWLATGSRTMWLWEVDGEVVSLCGIGLNTPHGFRIGPVFTPSGARGRGFASNLVAEVTRYGLEAGRQFGFLFTDLANPTSNRIYQRLGYEPVRDVDMWIFEEAA